MNLTAIPTSVTFFPSSPEPASEPAKAPATFVPLMPEQADLRSQTTRILQMVQDGRINVLV